jgi:hypothetical protein
MIRPLDAPEIADLLIDRREYFLDLFEKGEYCELKRQGNIFLEDLNRSLRIALGTNQLYMLKGLPDMLLSLHTLRKAEETPKAIKPALKQFLDSSPSVYVALDYFIRGENY